MTNKTADPADAASCIDFESGPFDVPERLAERIRLEPQHGRIWLNDRRMVLLHSSGLGVLRQELIDSLGWEAARGLLTRIGYNSGASDAELARTARIEQSVEEAINIGPQLHMLEGVVSVQPLRIELDVERGYFYGEYLWHGSVEAEEHLRAYGGGQAPACWMMIGYASAFVSVFMGTPVLFREVECCAQGAPHCHIVGKPVEDWDDAEEDLQYLRADAVTGGLSRKRHGTSTGPLPVPPQISTVALGDVDVVGASAGFNAACHMVRRVAGTQATVLFLGESGAGKEVLARGLHGASKRADQPFIAVNCAAIPDDLIEAELFGVEKGAFTGAQVSRPGRFERAHGGTLFLDEIGILSWTAQGKLLRALQEREIERVGDTRVRGVDVRVVAATNLDLGEEVKQGRFREDLYYRLNVFPIRVPPLRERREDIPIFMRHFLVKFNERNERDVLGFTSRAIDAMLTYDWPGNIRELENVIERGSILAADGGAIDTAHLFSDGQPMIADTAAETADDLHTDGLERIQDRVAQLMDGGVEDGEAITLDEIEHMLLDHAVTRAAGNISAAARTLGISRAQLAYRLSKHTG